MSKCAILVVDLQNEYFSEGKLPLTGIEAAAANARQVIDAARARGDRVIHIRHEARTPDAPFFTPGSSGVAIHPSVQPLNDEWVILKNYPNAFLKTDLKSKLDEAGVEELVIIGAMSHMCVEATSRAAFDLGYPVTVIDDACATRDLEFKGVQVPAMQVHAAAMAALAFSYAQMKSTAEYLA